jgi:hypothetical protein
MQRRIMWLRILTLANVVVGALVILLLYATLLALSVLAAEVSTWQLVTLLATGVAISLAGLRLTKNAGSRGWRWIGLVVNGAAMMLYAAIIVGIGALLVSTTSRRFVIPEGYKGDVYIVYLSAGMDLQNTRLVRSFAYRATESCSRQ